MGLVLNDCYDLQEVCYIPIGGNQSHSMYTFTKQVIRIHSLD